MGALTEVQKSFTLHVTGKLERKIRYLCSKLPTKEYSGPVFYTTKGTWEKNNLEITCVDFFLQNIGSGTYTEYKYSPDITNYMVMNNLIDCNVGILHSHNQMATFFSGTDKNTLEEEGKICNHCLSVIVNNKGDYSAAITRKIKVSDKGDRLITYNTFGNREIKKKERYTDDNEIIEYSYLKVITDDNDFTELNTRIDLLEKAKAPLTKSYDVFTPNQPFYYNGNKSVGYFNTNTDKKAIDKIDNKKEVKVNDLFKDFKFDNTVADEVNKGIKEYNYFDEFKLTPIECVKLLITGSIFSKTNNKIDLDRWIRNMTATYNSRFNSFEEFQEWEDVVLDYVANISLYAQVEEENKIEDYVATVVSILEDYQKDSPKNKYLEYIIDSMKDLVLENGYE